MPSSKKQSKTKYILSFLLFLMTFSFSFWSNSELKPQISDDSGGYIRLAKDFTDEVAEIRPFFYPLFLKICMNINSENWMATYCLLQLLFHSFMIVALFFLFQIFKLKNTSSFILSLVIGLNPNLIYYSTYLYADHFFAILTTISWIFTIRFLKQRYSGDQKILNLILIGIFSGLAIVTKPISLLMIFPIVFSILSIYGINKKIIKVTILLVIINFSGHFLWGSYKTKNNPDLKFELMDFLEYSINMTAIRAGLVDAAIGTPFYIYLENNYLLETARSFKINYSYTMNSQPGFWEFKNSIPWDVRNDKAFAVKVIKNEPIKLFIASIGNWHSFFTKRCFFPGNQVDAFIGIPTPVLRFYKVSYSLFYRPFLLFFFIISSFFLWSRKEFVLLFPSFSYILYASLTVSILSAHGGEFIRYRVWIEYIMWFYCLFPFGYIIDLFTRKIRNYIK